MSVIIDNKLENQILSINNLQLNSIKFGALIGYLDTKNNRIKILKLISFSFDDINNPDPNINDNDINHLLSLNSTLPNPLEILGILYFNQKVLEIQELIAISHSLNKLKYCKIIATITKELLLYSVSDEKPMKIVYEKQELSKENLVNLLYTMEFETSENIINNIPKMKEAIFTELKKNWEKVSLKKKGILSLGELSKQKKQLDRILELYINPNEACISTYTDQGKMYLAYDLHMNIYPIEEIKVEPLKNLHEFFLKALSQDLQLKLQRAYFDEENNTLILPKKVRIRFLDLELNAYLSTKNPSKFEFDMLSRILLNATILDELNYKFESRVLLKDLYEYYLNFPGKQNICEIEKMMDEL
ncbi:MAG: hypothetical protein ACFFDW_13745 [Candidatus Thorarchaeota archaeon]